MDDRLAGRRGLQPAEVAVPQQAADARTLRAPDGGADLDGGPVRVEEVDQPEADPQPVLHGEGAVPEGRRGPLTGGLVRGEPALLGLPSVQVSSPARTTPRSASQSLADSLSRRPGSGWAAPSA
ncbi:hypothetical protein ACIQNK_12910 [Streptomyces sp. NPDC091273]|uniref:hypothetical protein n=1 Tax=Streptomyces sp. NPDC091273 TaxID=3365982 RepID=UPI00382376E8